MSHLTARKAFESALKTYADAEGLPVAWENVKFVPNEAPVYLQPALLPSTVESADLQLTNRRSEGIFQVAVVVRHNVGLGPAYVLGEDLDSLFPPSVSMLQDGRRVWVTRPMQTSPAIPEGERTRVVFWWSYALDFYP